MAKKSQLTLTEKVLKQFDTISGAAKQLGFSRPYFHKLLREGLTDLAKDRIKGRGYSPITFKPLK